MWETGARKTIANMFEDVTRGEAELAGGPRWERFKQRFDDWKNERLEGLARPLGRKLWGEMKQNADALSAACVRCDPAVRAVPRDQVRRAAGHPPAPDRPFRRRHRPHHAGAARDSEEHTSELQSLMRISYAVFCLKKK